MFFGIKKISPKYIPRFPFQISYLYPTMSKPVRAKKHLGQHFLTNEAIAQKIGGTLTFEGYSNVIEIGPGTGVLTKYLLEKWFSFERFNLIWFNIFCRICNVSSDF